APARADARRSDRRGGSRRRRGRRRARRARLYARHDGGRVECREESVRRGGTRGLFPSPLWGGVRGGGPNILRLPYRSTDSVLPPSPTLPHKGGGSTPSMR